MLAFRYRFHGHGSLRYVYKNGRAIRSHFATVKYTANPRRRHPRVAVVVSKKVHKGAVGRNRIRRRIYEAVRQNPQFGVLQGCDIVFIITSAEVRTVPAADVVKLVDSSLQEIIAATDK